MQPQYEKVAKLFNGPDAAHPGIILKASTKGYHNGYILVLESTSKKTMSKSSALPFKI